MRTLMSHALAGLTLSAPAVLTLFVPAVLAAVPLLTATLLTAVLQWTIIAGRFPLFGLVAALCGCSHHQES